MKQGWKNIMKSKMEESAEKVLRKRGSTNYQRRLDNKEVSRNVSTSRVTKVEPSASSPQKPNSFLWSNIPPEEMGQIVFKHNTQIRQAREATRNEFRELESKKIQEVLNEVGKDINEMHKLGQGLGFYAYEFLRAKILKLTDGKIDIQRLREVKKDE